MKNGNRSIIGIVGGMGPGAGINLFNAVLEHTQAFKDQDHLSVILMSFPEFIPDRTEYLEAKVAVNPAYSIADVISKMEVAGAEVIGIACNTAHSPLIFDVVKSELIRRGSNVQLLHMPFETCRFIQKKYHGVRRVALMATNGTSNTKLYHNLLAEFGYDIVTPDAAFQNNVIHKMIYDRDFGLKAASQPVSPRVHQLLKEALDYFKKMNADAIILGCTEFSLLLKEKVINGMYIIDAADVLAYSLVKKAMAPGMQATAGSCGLPEFAAATA
jgi:aspartate racemase